MTDTPVAPTTFPDMTLLDLFAACALIGIARRAQPSPGAAQQAYRYALEMLAEKAKH